MLSISAAWLLELWGSVKFLEAYIWKKRGNLDSKVNEKIYGTLAYQHDDILSNKLGPSGPQKEAKWQKKFRVLEFSIFFQGSIKYRVLILVIFVRISQTFHGCGPIIYAGLRGFWLGIRVLLRFSWFVCEIFIKLNRNKLKKHSKNFKTLKNKDCGWED